MYAKAAVLLSDFKALPALYVSQQNAILHALLHHFEKVCPTKAEELADELAVAEAGGIAFNHSQEQLLALIATHTSKQSPLVLSAAERERGRDKPGSGKREIKSTRSFPCNNCGNDPKGGEPNHHPYYCKYKPQCYGTKRKGISGCPCGQRMAKEQRVKRGRRRACSSSSIAPREASSISTARRTLTTCTCRSGTPRGGTMRTAMARRQTRRPSQLALWSARSIRGRVRP